MMVVIRTEMVIKLTVWVDYFGYDPAGRKFLKIAVNRRQPDPAELTLHFQPYFFRTDVSHLFSQNIQNGHSFRGGFHFYRLKCLFMHITHSLMPDKWKPFLFTNDKPISGIVKLIS